MRLTPRGQMVLALLALILMFLIAGFVGGLELGTFD